MNRGGWAHEGSYAPATPADGADIQFTPDSTGLAKEYAADVVRVADEIEWVYYEFIQHRQEPSADASACTHLEAFVWDIKQVAICRRWRGHDCRRNEEAYFQVVSDPSRAATCQYRTMTFTEKTADQPQSAAGSVISTWRRHIGEQILPDASAGDTQTAKGQVADAAACEVLCYEHTGVCHSFNFYANEDGAAGTCTLNDFKGGAAATHTFAADPLSEVHLGRVVHTRAEYYEFGQLSQAPYPDRAYPHEWNARCTHKDAHNAVI